MWFVEDKRVTCLLFFQLIVKGRPVQATAGRIRQKIGISVRCQGEIEVAIGQNQTNGTRCVDATIG